MKRFAVALSALALLAASCSTSCSVTPSETTHRMAFPHQSPAPKPVAHVGDTLNLMRIGGQKIAVTLEQVINPATVPNGWGKPDKSYIATKITIKNTGTTTIVGNSNSDVSVVVSDNQVYRADFAAVTECKDFLYGWFIIPANEAPEGNPATGCVTFALPQGVTPVKVTYSPSSGISRDVGEWLTP
jgi:hypothetical protein